MRVSNNYNPSYTVNAELSSPKLIPDEPRDVNDILMPILIPGVVRETLYSAYTEQY